MNTVKKIVSVLFLLSGLGSLIRKDFVPTFLFILLGFLLYPTISFKIKERFKLWNNKVFRYCTYIIIFILIGRTIPSYKNSNPGLTSKPILSNKIKEEKTTPTAKEWVKIDSIKKITGTWVLVKILSTNNLPQNIKNGDEKQKHLYLKKDSYQTSYPYGLGENPKFDCEITNDYLLVKTKKTKQIIYSFKIYSDRTKKYLKLENSERMVQIFRKKQL